MGKSQHSIEAAGTLSGGLLLRDLMVPIGTAYVVGSSTSPSPPVKTSPI